MNAARPAGPPQSRRYGYAPELGVNANCRKRLRALVARVPVLRSVAAARSLRLTAASQQQAIEHFEELVARYEERVAILDARDARLLGEIRTLNDTIQELRGLGGSAEIAWPLPAAEILAAEPDQPARSAQPRAAPAPPPYTFNWVVPPLISGSGGHNDIFRTISHLESRGHRCRIYFHDPRATTTFAELRAAMGSYPDVAAELHADTAAMAPCDAIFATSWKTAYPVFAYAAAARKFYFVQDFEPWFEPAGTNSTLAANTYRFGLHGLTLGSWLAEKLAAEFGMRCDAFEFGVDAALYTLRPGAPRRKVLFYARPSTPRRGFELGVLALSRFHAEHPEYSLELVGGEIDQYALPFACSQHGILDPPALAALYNECAAGLVLSLTNMSLLPLEMLACGCLPVSNDAQHTRQVAFAQQLYYGAPTPQRLAAALHDAVTAGEQPGAREAAASYAQRFDWADSNAAIEAAILRELAAGEPPPAATH